MRAGSILIVDDDATIQLALRRILEQSQFAVSVASTVREALQISQKETFHLVISDLRLPDGDGLEVMRQLKSATPDLPCIMLTGFATVNAALEATKKGAFDFIEKPFDTSHLMVSVRNAIENYRLKQQNMILKTDAGGKGTFFEKMIGRSAGMLEVFDLIKKVADSDSTILIRGESGTGKELIAKAIHHHSKRADQLLVPINCGAIPKDLLESELFGHVKGAFTGAIANRMGRFEAAHSGTLFLDEIAELTPALQVKLLRVLQEHCFEPIGSTRTVHVDARIIAATNQNLEQMIQEKQFREDLFYRLNVIPIVAPPLRERREDISLLVEHFLTSFNKRKKKNVVGMNDNVLELLENYSWPGNVRELENLIERIVILKGEGHITVADLPEKVRQKTPSTFKSLPSPSMHQQTAHSATQPKIDFSKEAVHLPLPESGINFNLLIEQLENNLILQALERTKGNRNQAAALLKLNRTTLVEKIKKKGLSQHDPQTPESTPQENQ